MVVAAAMVATFALVAAVVYFNSPDETDASDNSASSSENAANGSGENVPLAELVGGFDTTRIAFEPGTSRFTPAGLDALQSLRSALVSNPEASLAFDIRTYTEDNAANNHTLSIEQAEAVTTFMLEDGNVDASQISTRGLGSADIDAGDHLSHFVTISLPDASRSIQNSIAETSGFAFATDPGEWPQAIPEASALAAIVSLVEEEGTEVSIAVSTFDEAPSSDTSGLESDTAPDPNVTGDGSELVPGNEAEGTEPSIVVNSNELFVFEADAGQIRDSIQQALITSGVDPSMVTITELAGAVQVPSGVNNVVSVVMGEQAELTRAIAEIDSLRFRPGTGQLENNSRKSLEDVADLLVQSRQTLIVNVHTFSQATAEDNLSLSITQAEAAVAFLEDQGVPAERLRPVGSGNSSQFDESDLLTLTVLTIAQ